MATTTARQPVNIPPARRSTPTRTTASPTLVAKGATARSAVSPRATAVTSSPQRRTSLRIVPTAPPPNGIQDREVLTASLKRETDQKEDLLVQLQNKDQTITTITTENSNLTSALAAAEARLAELYRDQARVEDELAARHEVIDKLRTEVKDLEKEKRDIHRRYNEQAQTFDAERQAFYDNEQHLKSRIQSLTQSRKALVVPPRNLGDNVSIVSELEYPAEEPKTPRFANGMSEGRDDDEGEAGEPAEMTALRLELSTLSTSHNSLQSTLQLLQTQLLDLKRVNNELQEENESYNILLREKTLTGQFDILRQVGRSPSVDEDEEDGSKGDNLSLRSTGRSSTLERLPEIHETEEDTKSFDDSHLQGDESPSRNSTRQRRRPRTGNSSPTPKGESLGDLPITGPGLDLAAELGRAENKDIFEGRAVESTDNAKSPTKNARPRKKSSARDHPTINNNDLPNDIDVLRNEVRSLKDANKALSLYASKIIDRIIAHEGFEQVLSVDFVPQTPLPNAGPVEDVSSKQDKRARAQSAVYVRPEGQTLYSRPEPERLTTFDSFPPPKSPLPSATPTKRSRRSLSFDWKSFSMFGGGGSNQAENPNLRPLTLKVGSVANARKLETTEDDDDRRERERLNATMKLMGIDPSTAVTPTPMIKSHSTPATLPPTPPESKSRPTSSSRFSWFRRSANGSPSTSAPESAVGLTTEALERAEAESKIAALEAREQFLREEIGQGKASGFTELSPRSSLGEEWRSRRSNSRLSGGAGSGSGSTVWSAGMSRAGEEAE